MSPATIRNEMKQLEEMHFIEKTHTSSEGFHLNQGLDIMSIAFRTNISSKSKQIQRLNQLLIENHYDSSTALSNFAHELSMKSQYATLVVRPNHKQDVINDIHLIRANNHLIILVMVFSSGHVENIHFVSHAQLNNINLNKIANF